MTLQKEKGEKMDALISVIVPIYNVEKYLKKCVDSIKNQTYKNIEIILVDDASPDNCGQMCDEYAGEDERIKVIHKENGGLSDARNVGLENARGEYIAFVDSDDYIESDMLEKLYTRIKEDKTDIALCSFKYVNEKGEELPERRGQSPIKNGVLTGEEALYKLTEGKSWYYAVAWNKLYKKSIFDTLRFPKGKIHEDEFIAHRVFYQCGRISLLQDELYCYLQREGSITAQPLSVKRLDAVDAMYDRMLFAKEHGFNTLAYAALSSMAQNIANFSPADECGKKRKREVYSLYLKANKEVKIRGLSKKRKLITAINKIFPHFLIYVKKLQRRIGVK